MAAGLSYAQSTTDDAPRSQRKFQGEGQRQGQAQGQRQHRNGPFADLLKDIDLTEDQMAQVKEVLTKHRGEVESFREKNGDAAKELHKNMRNAMMSKDYDTVHQVVDQIKVLDKDRPTIKAVADDIRSLLTSEQQVIFDKKIQEVKNNRPQKQMRGGGGQRCLDDANKGQRSRRGQGRNAGNAQVE